MERPLVTIIVPVYNVAPYLEQCLDSIKAQSYRDFEALLVNDGSDDASPYICRSYERADSRFRLIDKPNSGVSDSRNWAMDQAQGKYLQFVDGDDWLTPDATGTFLHTAESTGADLVLSHFYRVAGERVARRGHIKTDGVLTRREFAEQMMKAPANYYYGVLWNKFYRRSIVEAHHLRCSTQVDWCEDLLFDLEYIEYVRLIATVTAPLYYYRKREDGLVSSQATLRRTIATKRMTFDYYKELYQKLDLYEEQKAGVYRYLVSAATDGAVGPLSPRLGDEERPLA